MCYILNTRVRAIQACHCVFWEEEIMLVRPFEKPDAERLESALPESLRHTPVDTETLEVFKTLNLETREQRVNFSKLVPTVLGKDPDCLNIKLSQNS